MERFHEVVEWPKRTLTRGNFLDVMFEPPDTVYVNGVNGELQVETDNMG